MHIASHKVAYDLDELCRKIKKLERQINKVKRLDEIGLVGSITIGLN